MSCIKKNKTLYWKQVEDERKGSKCEQRRERGEGCRGKDVEQERNCERKVEKYFVNLISRAIVTCM